MVSLAHKFHYGEGSYELMRPLAMYVVAIAEAALYDPLHIQIAEQVKIPCKLVRTLI